MTSIAETRAILAKGYASCEIFQKYLVILRPSVCPFHKLIDILPERSSILDIGCGAGILLNLAASLGKVSKGIGIDSAQKPILAAQNASNKMGHAAKLEFQHHSVEECLPEETFDVVSMIDVMHHINPEHQHEAIAQAASRVSNTGILIYKDMVISPRWRAWANRIHDLVMARQWIHYVPAATIVSWMNTNHFRLIHKETINMLWYGHELMIFQRMESSSISKRV